jgi:hypothetical protein
VLLIALCFSKSFRKDVYRKNIFGIVNKYSTCIEDTIYNNNPIPGLNVSIWILEQSYPPEPPLKVITYQKGCADCTVRGSLNKPEFWDDDK